MIKEVIYFPFDRFSCITSTSCWLENHFKLDTNTTIEISESENQTKNNEMTSEAISFNVSSDIGNKET